MGQQQILDEFAAALPVAGRHAYLERHARQRRERLPVLRRERQRHERGPRIDELVAELLRQPVAEVGRADLRNRQAARRDDQGARTDRAGLLRVEHEAVGRRVAHRIDDDGPAPRDAARVALVLQHVDDRVAAVVAEELALVLFVPGHVMALEQPEEVARRIARQRRAREMRIRRQIVVGAGVQVREVAAAAARDADLLGEPRRVIDQHDAAAELPGDRGAHHPGGARADHGDVIGFHGADCTCPASGPGRRLRRPALACYTFRLR